jgi:hypothetical protein
MRNVSDKGCTEDQNTCYILNIFFPENRAFYKIMWKNIVETGRPQVTIWCMRVARWIPKATNTQSEYVILIDSPLQQWLHERASVLRCTHNVLFFCCCCCPQTSFLHLILFLS